MSVEFKDPQKSPYCIPNRAEDVDVCSRRDLASIALILSRSETLTHSLPGEPLLQPVSVQGKSQGAVKL